MPKLLLIIFSSLILSGCTIKNLFIKAPAGLEITTNSKATVFLGDQNLGSTPLKNNAIKAGSYTLRLIPDDKNLSPYEASLELGSAASTVIVRNFGTTLVDSSGYTLTLVPDQTGKATISVISDPDTSSLSIDGVPSGFTPLSKREISAGNHEISVTTPGFSEQKVSVIPSEGFNLIVNTKLKAEPITLTLPQPATESATFASPTPTSSPTLPAASAKPSSPMPSPSVAATIPKPYVTVMNTPDTLSAGGLNVRQSPSSNSESIGKADIGEHLKYLGETTSAGWHKVEFESVVGYVSAKYSTLTK
ncbi:MAG: PEGA domain-containing protein [Candidatus Moraniibacteriota bacterium]|nr:MAG: PEGA domain-containing protein [Candidatus Moranbacteria bacterium]